MSEPFVGEVRMFAGNFAPRGWAFCDGQLLAVSQNDALFSLLGTIYGGDGRTTFGLPDMRGRLAMHAGDGPGLSPRRLGSKSGSEKETLTVNQMPNHRHELLAANTAGSSTTPTGHLARDTAGSNLYVQALSANNTPLNSNATNNVGESRSHNNLMPFLCVHYIIALVGIYPSRH
ncbi:MAG: phage tail protein [Marinicella pacifica]